MTTITLPAEVKAATLPLNAPCPKCNAIAGESCTSSQSQPDPSGGRFWNLVPLSRSHTERVQAAKEQA